MSLHQGGPFHDDRTLREEGINRIYDILFDYRGDRDTLQRYYDKKHAEVDWEAYLDEHTRPQPPIVS